MAQNRLYLTLRVRKIRGLDRSSPRLMSKGRFSLVFAVALGTFAAIPAVHGQQAAPSSSQAAPNSQNSDTQNQDPLKRQLSDKERFKQQKELKQELHGTYKKWVDEDVHWIITDQELKAFKSLSNDEERDSFIEAFWQRRNPNPDSPENEFREEHYRRIAYANEHFAAGKPGWKTDRGHMYIAFGKPDDIESHPSGGMYDRPIAEGGGQTSTFPFEIWHYRYLEGVGDNIDIEFVDTCMCGDYHMTIDRSEKDALQHVPGAGATLYEQMGMSKQADRFRGGLENLGDGPNAAINQSKQFDRLEQFAKLQAPPPVKFKDLESTTPPTPKAGLSIPNALAKKWASTRIHGPTTDGSKPTPGAPSGWSSIPVCTPCTGPASRCSSTSASTHRWTTPTSRQRLTATSPGQGRHSGIRWAS